MRLVRPRGGAFRVCQWGGPGRPGAAWAARTGCPGPPPRLILTQPEAAAPATRCGAPGGGQTGPGQRPEPSAPSAPPAHPQWL